MVNNYGVTNSNKEAGEIIEELSLLFMYLTRFKEGKGESWQSWKGYDFKILDNLQSKGYITFSYRTKRIYFDGKGLEKTKQLLKKYGIEVVP